jgi:CDP-diacylglycerol--glycerol-3-phosphate 3-phosphatidyltransferase
MILRDMHLLVKKTPVFTAANVITLVRLLLLVPIFLLIRRDGQAAQMLVLFLVILGWLTDGLDGYLARRMGQISELGKILDPIVDKIFVLFLLLFLILLRDFPPWVLFIIFPRDLLILGGGFYLASKRKTVEQSQAWGKITTNALTATILAYLLRWRPVAPILLGLTLVLVVISTGSYGRLFLRKLQEV